jgi:hypothetical protein
MLYSTTGANKIANNTAPGVFFYYSKVTVPATGTVKVQEFNTTTPNTLLFEVKDILVYTGTCGSTSIVPASISGGIVTFNNVPAGSYVIRVKYDSKSIVGATAPTPTTQHYDFKTYYNSTVVEFNTNGLDLKKRP